MRWAWAAQDERPQRSSPCASQVTIPQDLGEEFEELFVTRKAPTDEMRQYVRDILIWSDFTLRSAVGTIASHFQGGDERIDTREILAGLFVDPLWDR